MFAISLLCVFPAQAQLLTGYGEDNAASDFDGPSSTALLTAPVTPDEPQAGSQQQVFSQNQQNQQTQQSQTQTQQAEQQPVDLEADDVRYDDARRIVSAHGNVILVQEGRILRADQIRYDLDKDTVVATGNVVLNEPNGDVHLSQRVEFNNKLKNGFVEALQSYLADGGRFTANNGRREGGILTVMKNAIYTACAPCKDNPDAAPPWQLRASEVTHDQEDAQVRYKNARFEVYGVPVAYTPFFAHADGSVERKSGFLTPSFAFQSSLGTSVGGRYYWNIAPDKDATIGLNVYSDELPLGTVEYRQRWDAAVLKLRGGLTYSERTDQNANDSDFVQDEEVRGHIFADGRWDINEKWRAGVDVAYVSDDQYANQYDITSEDVLENNLFVERFDGRNYAKGLVQAFQDLRISELQDDQPEVLPEITARFVGEPGSVPMVGGRWDARFDFLSLQRDGDGQDVNRTSADVGWERRLVSDTGLVADIEAMVRGDLYHFNDRDDAPSGSGRSGDSTESRFFTQLHAQAGYPVARNFQNSQVIVEPMAALTLAPEINDEDEIPNEDSQDVQLDASNLFNPGRFPGLDGVEDNSRVTYGVRAGLHQANGNVSEVFVGQSYRFDEDSNPFSVGSGLDEKNSDFVGYMNTRIQDRYGLGYRFQLDNDDLSPQRHEIDASANWDRLRLNADYLFAKPIEGTELTETREQLRASAAYDVTEQWRLRSGATQDLGSDPGLRRAFGGVDYTGDCVSWSLSAVRNFTDDASGDSDTEILLRIGLKNLGEFAPADLRGVTQ